ncbi:MAG: hypothetical protein WBZ33_12480 [Thermoactinomyces sp.]|jgi:hypothetical protein
MGLVIIILLMVVGILFLIIFNVKAVKNRNRLTSENSTAKSEPAPISTDSTETTETASKPEPKIETTTKVAPRSAAAKQEITRQTDQEYREALRRGLSGLTKPKQTEVKKDHIDDGEYRKILRQMQQKK